MSTTSNNPKRSASNSINGDPSPRSVVNPFASAKRHKTSTSESSGNSRPPLSILKYDIKHVSRKNKEWVESSGVSVEILSDQTVYDLVKIVCKETCVGQGQTVDDKSWDLTDKSTGHTFSTGFFHDHKNEKVGNLRSGQIIGSKFHLDYDDGYHYDFSLTAITLPGPAINKNAFPRRAALPLDVDFTPYNPGPGSTNLNDLYHDLNKFLFEKEDVKLDICLFQPGRKQVHTFIDKGYDGIFHAIHVPERYDSVEEMLFALNESVQHDKPPYEYDEYIGWHPVYNTFGVSIFPNTSGKWMDYKTHGCTCHLRYYKTAEQEALCLGKFLKTFPKCASAAGYGPNGKRSKTSERGWIVYRNGTLTVCRGQSRNQGIKCAPHPGYCDGEMKHEPENDDAIVGRVNITLHSLQELFCAAEALF